MDYKTIELEQVRNLIFYDTLSCLAISNYALSSTSKIHSNVAKQIPACTIGGITAHAMPLRYYCRRCVLACTFMRVCADDSGRCGEELHGALLWMREV